MSDDRSEAMDGNHALLVGNVLGALMRMAAEWQDQGGVETTIEPEMIDGNYTNCIVITRPSGRYIVTVEREASDITALPPTEP